MSNRMCAVGANRRVCSCAKLVAENTAAARCRRRPSSASMKCHKSASSSEGARGLRSWSATGANVGFAGGAAWTALHQHVSYARSSNSGRAACSACLSKLSIGRSRKRMFLRRDIKLTSRPTWPVWGSAELKGTAAARWAHRRRSPATACREQLAWFVCRRNACPGFTSIAGGDDKLHITNTGSHSGANTKTVPAGSRTPITVWCTAPIL